MTCPGFIVTAGKVVTTGKQWQGPPRHEFPLVDADPNAARLAGCNVDVDYNGAICTGQPVAGLAWTALERAPHALETSLPGVLAIGDVRAGWNKPVAAAGKTAQVAAALHQVLTANTASANTHDQKRQAHSQ
jgi:thioredoxin reductase (NADPH)